MDDESEIPLLEMPPRYTEGDTDFWVLSRSLVRRAAPDQPYAVISITNPELPPATIRESPHRRDILRLQFHDTADYGQPLHGQIAFTEEQARQIVAFAAAHREQARVIVCHCEAGVSRSAAVAAALSTWLNGEKSTRFFFANYQPNRWVYRLITEAIAAQNS